MRGHFLNRAIFGLLLIGVGILFLLQQMNIVNVDIGYIFSTYWPVFIIYFGLKGLIGRTAYSSGAFFWSVVVILIGLFFLGRNLGFLDMSASDFFKSLAPLLLIVFGITMILRPRGRKHTDCRMERRHEAWRKGWTRDWNRDEPPEPPEAFDSVGTVKQGDIPAGEEPEHDSWHGHDKHRQNREERQRYREEHRRERERRRREKHAHHGWQHGWNHGARNHSGFFNDLYLGHDYWELEPMNISHFVGDTVIDLTKARIPAGETRIVISAFIGDVKVFVPGDMEVGVSVASSSFIGDLTFFDRYENGFMRSLHADSPLYNDAEKRIRFQVSSFIGDIKVQRVG